MKADQNLAIFDIDGTLFEGSTQEILFGILRKNKVISNYQVVKFYCVYLLYKVGIINDPVKLRRKAYEGIKGIRKEEIYDYVKDNSYFFESKIPSKSKEMIKFHRNNGDQIIALSASTDPIINEICRFLKIDEYICTQLEFIENEFTGKFISPPPYGEMKNNYIENYLSKNGPFGKVYYYADDLSDLSALEKVDIPVCVNPCRRLKKIAISKKWQIIQ